MVQNDAKSKAIDDLMQVLAELTSPEDVYKLLQDLCTIREIADMSQRMAVARLLAAGTSYVDIQEATGASATTISRVSKCLNHGAGGYRVVIEGQAQKTMNAEGE